jgi:very-short-patch-repair endonuclease
LSIDRARALRRNMSPPERRLWSALKLRPGGFKFRRQHPADGYVLDFFCFEAAVAIEVDGLVHELGDGPDRDVLRDAALSSRGIKTLRFRATDVRDELDAVATAIIEECRSRTMR